MKTDEKDIRAALEQRFPESEYEVQRLLGFYEGRYETVQRFIRSWLAERLAEQAKWMLEYIDIDFITEAAMELGVVYTMPAPARSATPELYVFMFKPSV